MKCRDKQVACNEISSKFKLYLHLAFEPKINLKQARLALHLRSVY